MGKRTWSLSYECREELAQWVRSHCYLSLLEAEGQESLRGLILITREEVIRALAAERAEHRACYGLPRTARSPAAAPAR